MGRYSETDIDILQPSDALCSGQDIFSLMLSRRHTRDVIRFE